MQPYQQRKHASNHRRLPRNGIQKILKCFRSHAFRSSVSRLPHLDCFSDPISAFQDLFTRAVFNLPEPQESEDCLYLNVFAPRKARAPNSTPYPVLYWMYGGAWQFGNAGQPLYDGSHFAALEDVIVVSVNYRTNGMLLGNFFKNSVLIHDVAFGLPKTSALPLTERNVGVLDQRAGLQWVQSNIHHFGGDNSSVTIFGESAGAYAVDLLITSYSDDAPRPFRAAIMESGNYAYIYGTICNNTDFRAWDALAANLTCTGSDTEKLTCLKGKSALDIKRAQEFNLSSLALGFGHTCDEVTVVSNPRTRLESGTAANVPVIVGSNTADGSFYTITSVYNITQYFVNYPFLAPKADAILRNYSETEFPDPQIRLQQIHTDWFFHCVSYTGTTKDPHRCLH